jgi:hypothetical protein
MMYDNYSWNAQGDRDDLQTCRLDMTSYSSATLTFDVAYQVFTGYVDSLIVMVSTNCGATFTRLYAKGGTTLSTAGSGSNNFVPTAAQWRTETISLNGYVGQPGVIIQFENYNGFGNKLYIDNINVSGNHLALSLNLTALIQGFYLSSGVMNASVTSKSCFALFRFAIDESIDANKRDNYSQLYRNILQYILLLCTEAQKLTRNMERRSGLVECFIDHL